MLAKIWLLFLAMFYGAAFSICTEKEYFKDALYYFSFAMLNLMISIII